MRRKPVNKQHSAKQFRQNLKHTKAPNVQMGPMRGGWRF